MEFKIKEASGEHVVNGWVLDFHELADISMRLESANITLNLEIIEAVLLASAKKEDLINLD